MLSILSILLDRGSCTLCSLTSHSRAVYPLPPAPRGVCPEGDMAVSSSIGSNIFDIGLGLPLPWLLGADHAPHPPPPHPPTVSRFSPRSLNKATAARRGLT